MKHAVDKFLQRTDIQKQKHETVIFDTELDRPMTYDTKTETEITTETPIKTIIGTSNIHYQEIETSNQNNNKPTIFLEAIDRSTCDVDTSAPVHINPYVDENVDFSTELFKDKHTYPSTLFNTEKPISNKNVISIKTENNDDLEN